jgi:aldehyde:ferredoxin oxidoreductase
MDLLLLKHEKGKILLTIILEVAKNFIGGAGFGIKYLFDEVKAGRSRWDLTTFFLL